MIIDTNTMVSMTEAHQNFSTVAHLVDQYGSAVILKNNILRYFVIDFSPADEIQTATDEDVISVSKNLVKSNKSLYEELTK